MTKGADNVMIPRMRIDEIIQMKIEKHLYDFACEGLRTLIFA